MWQKFVLPFLSLLFTSSGIAATAEAQPYLVKDLNSWISTSESSDPTEFCRLGDITIFQASTLFEGEELWRTDGTSEGTVMVKDVSPGWHGSRPRNLFAANGLVFFCAADSAGHSGLWRTDGTAAGTFFLKSLRGQYSSSPEYVQIQALGGLLYFTERTSEGMTLWRTDGTQAGTTLVTPLPRPDDTFYGGPGALVAFKDNLYFSLRLSLYHVELWRTDGTAEGTFSLKRIADGPDAYGGSLISTTDRLCFVAGTSSAAGQLWTSDGTSDGTVPIATAGTTRFDHFGELAEVEGMIFAGAYGGLWKSDGTAAGTSPITTLASSPSNLTVFGGRILFTTDSGRGISIQQSDGTALGTIELTQIPDSNIDGFVIMQGRAFFMASVNHNAALWETDGTPAGTKVNTAPYWKEDSDPYWLTATDDKLFFKADDGFGGWEPWVADGTPGGATLLKEIGWRAASSSIFNLRKLGDTLFFGVYDRDYGYLWKSDGSEVGTVPVEGNGVIGTPSGYGYDWRYGSVVMGDKLYFPAYGGGIAYIREHDSAAVILRGTGGEKPLRASDLTVVGSTLFFMAEDSWGNRKVWRTDGTDAGTRKIDSANGINYEYPSNLRAANGKLYFSANHTSWFTADLFQSDGTIAGTTRIIDPDYINTLFPLGGSTYFGTSFGFFKSNGTVGCPLVQPLSVYNALPIGSTAYLLATDNTNNDYALYRTDGTPEGTTKIRTLRPAVGNWYGPAPYEQDQITYMVEMGGKLYFTVTTPTSTDRSAELWTSDGTSAGTRLVHTIPYVGGRVCVRELIAAGGRLYFRTFGTQYGEELWSSDGTPENTRFVTHLLPEENVDNNDRLRVVDSKLFFTAMGIETGIELHALDMDPPSSPSLTAAPSDIARFSAIIKGRISPHGDAISAWLEYGTTSNYGTRVEIPIDSRPGVISQPFEVAITGMTPNTTYHFRVTTRNTIGESITGNHTFTTPPNRAPWMRTFDHRVYYGSVGHINITALLSHAFDADGDNLTFSTAEETAAGGMTWAAEDGGIYYYPPAEFEGTDRVPVTVMDPYGGTMTLSISVTNSGPFGFATFPPQLQRYQDANHLYFPAIPDRYYRFQRSTDLKHWETLSTTSGTSDFLLAIDPNPPASAAFYRLTVPE